ncbi:EF-hand domain-containing protein [Lysobacter sp. A3-1-A15]|uniref:EF-hand domain-containing protein n=1 Tax=Novilysobacter viscosus TaxID=3098602 RepID=UPI002ED7FB0D
MNRYTFLTAAIAAALAGVAVAAPHDVPGGKSERGHPIARIDSNGDGAIDRAEAAAHPRLAARFDTMDANGDGRIDASERPQWKKRGHARGHGGYRGGGMGQVLKLDADGDGRISKLEAAGNERLAARFDAADRNQDGYLVRSELMASAQVHRAEMQARHSERMQQKFAAADADGDGRLSRAEVETGLPRIARMFAFMDEDRDGYLVATDLQHRTHR